MGKFTPLSEIKKSLDTLDDTMSIGMETEYESDSSAITLPVTKKKPTSILKELPSQTETPEEKPSGIMTVLKDILICVGAFIAVANPYAIKKILSVESLASLTVIDSDDIKEVVTKKINWKGFIAQIIGFIVVLIIFKLLAYCGIF